MTRRGRFGAEPLNSFRKNAAHPASPGRKPHAILRNADIRRGRWSKAAGANPLEPSPSPDTIPAMTERIQVAALPLRASRKNGIQILLVTSRDTGRWVPPKGWPMEGRAPWSAARIEALEEAGVIGTMSDEPLGSYSYLKRLEDGEVVPCRVSIYPLFVTRLKSAWKERKERNRRWFSIDQAAEAVDEPDLSRILRGLSDREIRKGRVVPKRATAD